jgi:hypothetical protein
MASVNMKKKAIELSWLPTGCGFFQPVESAEIPKGHGFRPPRSNRLESRCFEGRNGPKPVAVRDCTFASSPSDSQTVSVSFEFDLSTLTRQNRQWYASNSCEHSWASDARPAAWSARSISSALSTSSRTGARRRRRINVATSSFDLDLLWSDDGAHHESAST